VSAAFAARAGCVGHFERGRLRSDQVQFNRRDEQRQLSRLQLRISVSLCFLIVLPPHFAVKLTITGGLK